MDKAPKDTVADRKFLVGGDLLKISVKIFLEEFFETNVLNFFLNTYVDPKISKDSKNRTYKIVRSS